jgi:hypothetical protein
MRCSDGSTIVAPCVAHSSVPSTMPKQWYMGTGMQSRSPAEKRMTPAAIRALFTMLWCVSVAAFGAPVVPLVNWMLIGSSQSSPVATVSRRSVPDCVAPVASSSKSTKPPSSPAPIRIRQRSCGRRAARKSPGAQCASSGKKLCSNAP